MEHSPLTLDRRHFLGLSATAAVGALGLAGCAPQASQESGKDTMSKADGATGSNPAWLGEEPEIADSDIAETIDTDFLIIGAGTAGLAAAGAAGDLGMNFIVCEKAPKVPETREYLGAVNTAYAKENNVTVDSAKLLNELTRYASGKCNQKLIKMWIDESAEYVDWVTEVMKDQGKQVTLDMPPQHSTGGTDYYVPYVQHIWEMSYTPPMRNDVIAERLNEQGHSILFEHEMVKLVHEEGAVTGAIFKTKDGYKQINAKNTLLATGGYAANPVMMRALQPSTVACCTASSFNPTCTGDGIRAGLWAGASKDIDAAPMIFDRGAVAPGVDAGMTFDDYTAASRESGILMKADTLDELADLLGFAGKDKENFLSEVERYNGFYDQQVDEDFGKEAYRLSAIRQAPFYGCWFGGSLLTTIDGLRINENARSSTPN